MGNLGNFNVEENEAPQGEYALLPKGEYEAMVTKSEMKETKNGGMMLKVTYSILTEGYDTRLLWDNFNIVNASAEAQKIGRGQLSALCKAVGKEGLVDDSGELHEIPLFIKVDTKKGTNGYKDSNVVKGYRKIEGSFKQPKQKAKGETGLEGYKDTDEIDF